MITYTLKGKDLTKDEATALVEATSTAPIKIELSSVLNLRKADSAKLFKLSVEKKIPELANLAWKISVSEQGNVVEPSPSKPEVVAVQKPIDKLLDDLHQSNGLWAVGAAMILSATANGEWWTLRQVATYWVNNLDVPVRSVLYQGFELQNGAWEPVELRAGIDRRKTFHVAPVYIALRDALNRLLSNDLVVRTRNVSRGGHGGANNPAISAMSRVFYSVQINDRGKQIMDTWGDAEEFISSAFTKRLR
jgi:hypothetical protein